MSIKLNGTVLLWLLWLVLSGILVMVLIWKLMGDAAETDQKLFMPGPLTDGHHQLADKCDACHTDPLGGKDILQEACVACHGEDRIKPMDSHPRNKFTDPRNADTLKNIDALHCVTCHTEHKPEITQANGLSQPVDMCFHCHKDIAKDRPSHEGMAFNSCKTAGCHNFHNNRALYTDFLVKHMHEADLLESRKLPSREFAQILDEVIEYPREKYPVKPLTSIKQADAVTEKMNTDISHEWLDSSHAKAGVNCSACHVFSDDVNAGNSESTVKPVWHDHPDERGCNSCHQLEVSRHKRGKHGMRLAAGLPPMQVSDARLPMKSKAHDAQLSCNSCHGAHQFDTREAAVKGCLSCHDDEHSLAYEQSPHARLWRQEMTGDIGRGEGVSCASCHMPRVNYDVNEWMSRVMVDHNQNASLSPNSKMMRPACLHCHGLEFSINALSDTKLILNNFTGQPEFRTDSMRLAEEDMKRAEQEVQSVATD